LEFEVDTPINIELPPKELKTERKRIKMLSPIRHHHRPSSALTNSRSSPTKRARQDSTNGASCFGAKIFGGGLEHELILNSKHARRSKLELAPQTSDMNSHSIEDLLGHNSGKSLV